MRDSFAILSNRKKVSPQVQQVQHTQTCENIHDMSVCVCVCDVGMWFEFCVFHAVATVREKHYPPQRDLLMMTFVRNWLTNINTRLDAIKFNANKKTC